MKCLRLAHSHSFGSGTATFQCFVLCSLGSSPPAQSMSMISRASRVISRFSPASKSTSNMIASVCRPPAPIPTSSLPWERWSR